MKAIKGAIFDLDGTLLDSMYVWQTLGEEYLKSKQMISPENLRELLKPMSMQEAARYFRETLGLQASEHTIINEIDSMVYEQYAKHVSLKPFTREALNRLRSFGAKLCIATATDRALVEAALKRLDILDCFAFIMTCTEAGCGKNQPKIYCDALSKLGFNKDEVVVFEDAPYAIQTACNAGFRVVGVYDKTFEANFEKIQAITERYLYSWEDFEA